MRKHSFILAAGMALASAASVATASSSEAVPYPEQLKKKPRYRYSNHTDHSPSLERMLRKAKR